MKTVIDAIAVAALFFFATHGWQAVQTLGRLMQNL
jgi:hypothetical protein